MTKYQKVFWLTIAIFLSFGIVAFGKSEEEQGKHIDCLIITDQGEEKAVINKAYGLKAGTAYYIGKMYDQVKPITVNNQIVMPVHKFGIPGKEPEYININDSRI